ncbi:hypothetical protein AFIC_001685 [[Pseudomonas] carboxydohydrogena]|uniref:SPOR domain-containing protein n=1 Tax=Afipia carboxydohydrogena TaxID=290 RepID=A0ABY8BLB3_AFICR|nr:hypothetical protein [[Pseudomonas] carboxydohydrogena]WEF50161.1 hypothetical protein AFIC_001685 [[Pseudomonas] carboxydohydrogena]
MRNDRAKLDQIDDDAESGGWLSRLFANEEEFDRRAVWRLGSWGAASVCAVAAAMMVVHYSSGREHERMAEVSRQSQQLQAVERETKTESRRLAAAIDTLNNDRDRLFARVTVVEQSLDSVTGALAKPSSASSWPKAGAAAPIIGTPAVVASAAPIPAAPVATVPPALPEVNLPVTAAAHLPSLPTTKIEPAPEPDAQPKTPDVPVPLPHEEGGFGPLTVASLAPPNPETAEAAAEKIVRPVEFGIDLGSANSVEGLRAVWRGALKRVPGLVGSLQPLIVVREGQNGLGLRLHLVAGPLNDAAAAAKLCASLIANRHRCETTLFDGQRLALESPLGARVPREKPRRQARSHVEKRVEEHPQPPQQPQPQPAPEAAASRGFSFFNR